jgi:hypothetical protein
MENSKVKSLDSGIDYRIANPVMSRAGKQITIMRCSINL